MLTSQIPGFERAIARAARLEDGWRENAFLAPTEKLCGVTVRLLTLRMFAELCAVRSPFLCGGDIGGEDVVLLLWRLSPKFSRTDTELRARFAAFVRPIAFEELAFKRAVRSITRFVDRMLIDRPPSSGSRGTAAAADCSFVASLVHEFAAAYSWDEDRILDKPLPQLFQLLRKIQRDRNPELPRFNPLRNRITKAVRERARAAIEAKAKEEAACLAK